MATDIIMPQMGESIAEGTITRWIKNVGESVARDEPLFEISTDKVDAEIPSPAAGVLTEILVQSGQTVAVNTVVGRIGGAAEKPAAAPAAAPTPVSSPPAPTPVPAPPNPAPSAAEPETTEDRLRTRSSPLVRRIASERGVDITEIAGTGIAGRVTKNDLLAHLDGRPAEAPPAPAPGPAPIRLATSPSPAPVARMDVSRGERDEIVAMTVMRKKIAERMVESKRVSAHVATVFHVDYSNVARIRNQQKDAFLQANGTKLTFMPFIFQAVTAALKKFPDLNASMDGDEIIYHRDINLGMAVALDWGLIVPVIKNADEKSILGLARAANDLADRARAKKLKPEEVGGGTFTVTNPGIYGGLFGTPIIMQPQVAILGVGTIEKRPIVVTDDDGNDSLAIRTMGYLALSFDHRLIDGAVADQFMAFVKATIEEGAFSLA